ncbi:hypothetical protein V8C34DRAFT_270467 [Trichoderma compactum]
MQTCDFSLYLFLPFFLFFRCISTREVRPKIWTEHFFQTLFLLVSGRPQLRPTRDMSNALNIDSTNYSKVQVVCSNSYSTIIVTCGIAWTG